MSTIPTTSKRLRVPYTVVGAKKADKATTLPGALSVLVLNRGERLYKATTYSQLDQLGASEVLSIEGPAAGYDIESLARRFPRVRFILLKEDISSGEKVNIGIAEASGRFVLVLWNDITTASARLSQQILQRLIQDDVLCSVPTLRNPRRELLPTVLSPALYRTHLRVVQTLPAADQRPTLFPFDYCGVYHKERFTLLGGYDHVLTNPYWQKLDFGFRSFMWGEGIQTTSAIQLSYLADGPAEDTTLDDSYRIFFLKNLAVAFSRDSGQLPAGRFISYLLKTGGGLLHALREFREVRRWVEINKYRFRQDARSVTELWEIAD